MPITISPDPEWPGPLEITGDIQATLDIPAATPFGDLYQSGPLTYYIALSDGTLLRAVNDAERPDFQVVTEGAATVTIAPSGLSVTVSWAVEWITLAPSMNAIGVAQKPAHSLPLFAAPALVAA